MIETKEIIHIKPEINALADELILIERREYRTYYQKAEIVAAELRSRGFEIVKTKKAKGRK